MTQSFLRITGAFVMAALIGFKEKVSRKLVGDSKDLKKDTFKFLQIYNGDPNLLKLLV